MTKYKLEDQVKIVNYGHLVFNFDSKEGIDISPNKIGNKGIIYEAHQTQGID